MGALVAALSTAVFIATYTFAATPGLPPHSVSRSDDYMRTDQASWIWGVSLDATTTATLAKIDSSTTTPMLFHCGAQVLVSCIDTQQDKHHRSAAIACWVQEDVPVIANGSAISGVTPAEYDLGAGIGNITDPGSNSGQGACFIVHAGGSRYNALSCQEFKGSNPRATNRQSACASDGTNPTENVGRPCRNAGDCFSGGTCTAGDERRGAYLALVSTTTTTFCQVELAR